MNKHHRLFTLLLALCLALLLALPAAGAGSRNVAILVDGAPLRSEAYITEEGVTMVPLRAVAEARGFSVDWDPDTRTVSVTNGPDAVLRSAVVALDPGHGGVSTGAAYEGIREKALNLAIARETASLLEAAGVTVVLTRSGDEDVELHTRTELAARQGADLFVSIHCNASVTNPQAAGIYTAAYSRESEGWNLSQRLRQSMAESTGAADLGGEERPELAVLRTATMPAALVECGFMSTPEELALLVQPEYQAKLAQGIAHGITAYLTQGA